MLCYCILSELYYKIGVIECYRIVVVSIDVLIIVVDLLQTSQCSIKGKSTRKNWMKEFSDGSVKAPFKWIQQLSDW